MAYQEDFRIYDQNYMSFILPFSREFFKLLTFSRIKVFILDYILVSAENMTGNGVFASNAENNVRKKSGEYEFGLTPVWILIMRNKRRFVSVPAKKKIAILWTVKKFPIWRWKVAFARKKLPESCSTNDERSWQKWQWVMEKVCQLFRVFEFGIQGQSKG